MGWEKRNNNNYYYRKHRVGRDVVSRYVGKGESAEKVILEDRDKWEKERKIVEKRRKKIEDNKLLQQQIGEFGSFVEAAVSAALLLSGFHNHKGQWRKKRHG